MIFAFVELQIAFEWKSAIKSPSESGLRTARVSGLSPFGNRSREYTSKVSVYIDPWLCFLRGDRGRRRTYPVFLCAPNAHAPCLPDFLPSALYFRYSTLCPRYYTRTSSLRVYVYAGALTGRPSVENTSALQVPNHGQMPAIPSTRLNTHEYICICISPR